VKFNGEELENAAKRFIVRAALSFRKYDSSATHSIVAAPEISTSRKKYKPIILPRMNMDMTMKSFGLMNEALCHYVAKPVSPFNLNLYTKR
jgi:hypothetical protein